MNCPARSRSSVNLRMFSMPRVTSIFRLLELLPRPLDEKDCCFVASPSSMDERS